MTTSTQDDGVIDVTRSRWLRPRRERSARVLPIAIVTLLMVELVARLLEPQLSADAEWNHAVPGAHVRNIEQLAAAGGVDILIVGSSVVGAGIDPQRLAREVGAVRGAYNFWMAGPSMASIELLTSTFALPALSPRVMVIGVSSRELNDKGRPQSAHGESLRASISGRQLLASDHPFTAVERAVTDASALMRTRQELRQPGRVLDAVRGVEEASAINPRGMDTSRLDRVLATLPDHVAQEKAALRPFAVGGDELDALARLIVESRRRGVDVVLVDMPVVEDIYVPFHENGAEDDIRYKTTVASFAEVHDIDLVSSRDVDWAEQLFADENHVNASGAKRLTSLVGDALGDP